MSQDSLLNPNTAAASAKLAEAQKQFKFACTSLTAAANQAADCNRLYAEARALMSPAQQAATGADFSAMVAAKRAAGVADIGTVSATFVLSQTIDPAVIPGTVQDLALDVATATGAAIVSLTTPAGT